MNTAESFLSALEIAYWHAAKRNPNKNAARIISQGAMEVAEMDMTQDHVPERWRGAAVGGALSYIQTIATFIPTEILRRIEDTHIDVPISSPQFISQIQILRQPNNTQLLQVLFLERNAEDSPLPQIQESIREATLTTVEFVVSSIPIVGSLYGIYELIIDRSPITGHRLSTIEKVFIGLGAVLELVTPVLRGARTIRRTIDARLVNNVRRLSPRLTYPEAYRLVSGTKFLSDADWAEIQRLATAIRSGRITKSLVIESTRLIGKFRVLARASEALDDIARTRGSSEAAGFFDYGDSPNARRAVEDIQNLTHEINAGSLIQRLGLFQQAIRLGADETMRAMILRARTYLSHLTHEAQQSVLSLLSRRARSSDLLLDRRVTADVVTLRPRASSAASRVRNAMNKIQEKGSQANIVIIINDIAAFTQREIMEIATKFWGRNLGTVDRIIWLNLGQSRVIGDFSRPPTLNLLEMLEEMSISNVGRLIRGWREDLALDDNDDD